MKQNTFGDIQTDTIEKTTCIGAEEDDHCLLQERHLSLSLALVERRKNSRREKQKADLDIFPSLHWLRSRLTGLVVRHGCEHGRLRSNH
jgi:hypothetical protein